jgi:hypothetical protein
MAPPDAFDDADQLEAPAGVVADVDLAQTLASLLRAQLCGDRDGAIETTIREAPAPSRPSLLLALVDVLRDSALVQWIEADPRRRAIALAIAKAIAPPDLGATHNAEVMARMKSFDDWGSYAYRMLVVPGYTPLDEQVAKAGVHPVALRRLQMAADDLRARKAPFVLLSGSNVYPRGTPYYEALEMKKALVALGVDAGCIAVETRARHTPTNLRNAGRFMRAHGIASALIVTKGPGVGGSDFFGQDFYLAHPDLSTFHLRCERELGYRVGDLRGVDDGRIELTPSADVDRPSYRDPLDP